jgi:hypothetical protein
MAAAMSGEITNVVGRVSDDPGTRAKAIVYLWRTGNLDLLAVFGLDAVLKARHAPAKTSRTPKVRKALPANGYQVIGGKVTCATCCRRTQPDGVCRRRDCGGAR